MSNRTKEMMFFILCTCDVFAAKIGKKFEICVRIVSFLVKELYFFLPWTIVRRSLDNGGGVWRGIWLNFVANFNTMRLFALLIVFFSVNIMANGQAMSGPYAVIARDGEFRLTKGGSERDMRAALDAAREGRTDEALAIINAYATTLQRIDGHDAPLCLIQCFDLVRAMHLMREHQRKEWGEMVRRAILPTIDKY